MIRKIVLINGNPEKGKNPLNQFQKELKKLLEAEGFSVDYEALTEKEIKSCVGCWDCWWKTPGVCRHKDDVPELLKKLINADLIIYASPLIMGMYSGLLKAFHDRIIPLVHPYIEIREGECHHQKRYPDYPKMGVLIEERDSTKEEIENVQHIFDRIAINFHSEVIIFASANQKSAKDISHAISHI